MLHWSSAVQEIVYERVLKCSRKGIQQEERFWGVMLDKTKILTFWLSGTDLVENTRCPCRKIHSLTALLFDAGTGKMLQCNSRWLCQKLNNFGSHESKIDHGCLKDNANGESPQSLRSKTYFSTIMPPWPDDSGIMKNVTVLKTTCKNILWRPYVMLLLYCSYYVTR